jgi:ankyrin repeat protein
MDILVEYDRLRLSDIDVQDLQGRTALHAAAEANSLRVARKLMELGADAAAVDFSNVSVLGLAARQTGSEPLVNLLLANQMTQVSYLRSPLLFGSTGEQISRIPSRLQRNKTIHVALGSGRD